MARNVLVVWVLLVGCFPQDSQPSIDEHREPTAEELDQAEYDQLGCLGAYEYDFRRNCRYPTLAVCDVEHFYGCQPGSERNAFDLDGTCWHFNRCVPDANLWPVTGSDVCDHDRTEVPFCPEAEVSCEEIETSEQCQTAAGCKPAFAYRMDEAQRCVPESSQPVYIGCVPDDPACEDLEIDHFGEDCVARNVCARTPDCEPRETRDGSLIPCDPCPEDDDVQPCSTTEPEPDPLTVELRAVTFAAGGANDPIGTPLAAEPADSAEPCVSASLGPLQYRQGTELTLTPSASTRYEILAAVRNEGLDETCGFAGQPVSARVVVGAQEETVVAYWPPELPCSQDTWVSIVLEDVTSPPAHVQLTLIDSCGTGGGTIELP